MANGPEHKLAGGIFGVMAEWIIPDDDRLTDEERLRLRATASAAGVIGGMFPDKLEPATSPNHRNHFHSLLAVGVLACAVVKISGYEPKSMKERYWIASSRGFMVGYLSHLALDASTPKGLPVI